MSRPDRQGGRPVRPPASRTPSGRTKAGQARKSPPTGGALRPGGGLGGERVAGRRAVRELLAAGRREVSEIWLAEGIGESQVLSEIVELAAESGIQIQTVSRTRLGEEAGTDAPQGVMAIAAPLADVGLDRLAEGRVGRKPLVVVLDGVTDPHNVGAVLRSAESAGATGAVLARHGGPCVTPTVAKAAAGAIEHLDLASVSRVPAALNRLKDQGLWIVGLDGDAPTSLFGLELLTEPVALVLGSEGQGMGRLTAERCDVVASIPRLGQTQSLNVSAAATLGCFEVLRARN